MTRRMGDSAYPPGTYPAVDAWAFYIGGNTPHVWSDREVAAIPSRYRLPIFTRSVGGDPARDAAAAVAWCRDHSQPPGTLTALDFEDRVAPAYLRAYDAAVNAAGWVVAVYGQQSTVLGNPRPSGGYWVANWDEDPSAAKLQPGWAARQYAGDTQLGHPWDLSVVADTAPLWDTQAPAPPPDPAPAADPAPDLYLLETAMLLQIESLASDTRSPGSKGQYAYGMGALYGQGSITFSADGGLNGNQTAAALRVVCWNDSGWHITNVVVGYPEAHKVQVMFPTDSPVYAVTVTRTDDGDFPVAVAVP